MYGRGGGVVAGTTTTVAGVAVLPNTGGNTLLGVVSVVAIVAGAVATIAQVAVIVYRRRALKA